MPVMEKALTIGDLARRSGLAHSALRHYEAVGLIDSLRTDGNQRRYARSTLRRVAFVRAAQAVGLSLDDIKTALAGLPTARTPNAADWKRLASAWRPMLDERISELVALRDRLDSCIGCGCLSMRKCALYNPQDKASRLGPGAGYLKRR
jgi:MerR family transcriptional regulator, redox-sensitive transcriptional activator SoxR